METYTLYQINVDFMSVLCQGRELINEKPIIMAILTNWANIIGL